MNQASLHQHSNYDNKRVRADAKRCIYPDIILDNSHGTSLQAANRTSKKTENQAIRPPRTNQDEDLHFYKELPELTSFADVLLERSFVPLPMNWTVVITDVIGSTKAIEAGRYKEVNALGAASIIGIKNVLPDIELPFCFGGDGATLAVPTCMLDKVDSALRGLQNLATKTFRLQLRTGRVSVQELADAGHPIFVVKYRASRGPPIACFRGSGIVIAEEWIKSDIGAAKYNPPPTSTSDDVLNLHGLECRWKPAHNKNGTICSIIIKTQPSVVAVADREAVYSAFLSKIEGIIGEDGGVLTVANLQLQDLFGDFSVEAKLLSRADKTEWIYYMKLHRARFDSLLGRFLCYWKLNAGGFPGKTYLQDVAQNTDHRKFDETLRMVVDMSIEGVDELTSWLESQYNADQLFYGVHRSDSALITCMINSYEDDHLHFVDGNDGGYALAAKGMKAQMKDCTMVK